MASFNSAGPQYFTAGPSQPEQAPAGTVAVFAALVPLLGTLGTLQTFGAHAPALYNAEAEKSQVWSAATPGATPPSTPLSTNAAAPQLDPRGLAGAYYSFAAASQSGGGLRSYSVPGTPPDTLYNAEATKTAVWRSASGGTVITDVLGASYEFGTHAAQTYNAEAQKTTVWRSAPGSTAPVGFLGAFTGAQPQLVDLTLQPFIDAPQFSPQGYIVPFQEAEPQDGSTFQPPPALVPQPAAPLYQPLRQFTAAPQAFDFTLPAQVEQAAANRQGATVGSFVAAPQSLDLTIQPLVFRSVASAQGPTVPSFSVPPQAFDYTLQPQVQRSLRRAQGVARYAAAAPQAFDFTLQPQVRAAQPAPPILTNALGHFVSVPPQVEVRSTPVVWQTAQLARGLLGARVFTAPQLPPSWPYGYRWLPLSGVASPSSLLGRFFFVQPQIDPSILEDPSGPYFNRPPNQRRFGWALVIALKQTGVQGVNTVISALSQAGVQGAESRFLDGSACLVTAAYYDENNLPFAPSQVSYRIDDLLSETNILPWTALSPAVQNQVVVTSAQNTMVSLSRSSEKHQVLFEITDGYGEQFYARVVFDIERVIGGPPSANYEAI